MSESYKVSVQALSSDQRVVAQDDSIPVNWTYPTTMWVPGEYISDEHVVCLPSEMPAGRYRFLVVVYEERTLERVASRDRQADAIELGEMEVVR